MKLQKDFLRELFIDDWLWVRLGQSHKIGKRLKILKVVATQPRDHALRLLLHDSKYLRDSDLIKVREALLIAPSPLPPWKYLSMTVLKKNSLYLVETVE